MGETYTNLLISPQQILLLKAALFPKAEALSYWQLWKKARQLDHFNTIGSTVLPNVFDTLDYESQRLMPLVYRNLEKTNDPLIPSLRGIYRHTWIRNQKFLQKVQQVIGELQAAGIETIALKGIPLSLSYYGDMGVRLMSDLDVLVPTAKAEAAMNVLQQKPLYFKRSKLDYRYRRIIHAIHMWDADKVDMDLHWNLILQHSYAEADTPFWTERKPMTLANGHQIHVLAPTHQLFHNMVHGYGWRGVPAIRWVADSYAIYTKPGICIDWHALLDMAEHYRLIVPIQQGLNLLQAEFNLLLPLDVRERLNQLTFNITEATYFALLEKKPVNLSSELVRRFRLLQMGNQLFPLKRSRLTVGRWALLRLERYMVYLCRWLYDEAQIKFEKLRVATIR